MSLLSWLGKAPATKTPAVDNPLTAPTTAPTSDQADFHGYRIVERADGRFNIVGSRGCSINTRQTREQAEQCILKLILAPPKPAATLTPSRSSSRIKQSVPPANATPQPKSNADRPPGISNKKRKEVDVVQPEVALLDYLESNPIAKRSKHGQLSVDCAFALGQVRADAASVLMHLTVSPARNAEVQCQRSRVCSGNQCLIIARMAESWRHMTL